MKLKSFLSFERMITPVIIKILFWISLGLSILSGVGVFIGAVITGIAEGSAGGIIGGILVGVIGGLLTMLLGILFTRIYAELLILAFRINETLTDIKELLASK